MYVQRLLQINIATLAALGTAMLGLGQQNAMLPACAFLTAFASVWITDITGWFRLNRVVTNVAALVAFFIFWWQVSQLSGVVRILAVGNLLVYLQVILLFQKKEFRTYWQIVLLSLLEVLVAAVFDQEILFGLLLVVYLFGGLSAMALLFLHRERCRYQPAEGEPPARHASRVDRQDTPGTGPEMSFVPATSGFAGQSGIMRELRGRVLRIGLGTLLLVVLFFLLFPRWGRNPWRGAMTQSRRSVGFSDTVSLGELGQIIENPEEVLRIQFFDAQTDEPYQVNGEVYLRGTILTHYSDGQWSYRGPRGGRYSRPLVVTRPPNGSKLVRQRITIEPMDRRELFSVWPFFSVESDPRLRVESHRDTLVRQPSDMSARFVYELVTTGIEQNSQPALVPRFRRKSLPNAYLLAPPGTRGFEAMPELVTLANRWMTESGVDPEDRLACARMFERQLRDSNRFEYSLVGQNRDPTIDPIEDFLTNNPRGHCEYFASALVLMLRTQGIPARLVVGYKTAEWNRLGQFFQVRQLHAHTWVEVYLEPESLRGVLASRDPRWGQITGAWLRLDSTPFIAAKVNPVVEFVGSSFDWLDFLWASYVIELDRPRQNKAVYTPLAQWVQHGAEKLVDLAWWKRMLGNMGKTLGPGVRDFLLGLVIALLAIGLFVAYRVCRLLLGRWYQRLAGQQGLAKRRMRSSIDFYRRLESVLAQFGLTRLAWQTPREFANEAAATITRSTGDPRIAALPGRVVEAFYRVRFGGEPLDTSRAQAVEQALADLASHSELVTVDGKNTGSAS